MPLNLQAFQEKLPISAQDQDRLDVFRASLAALEGGDGVAAVLAAHVSAPRRKLTATEHAQYALVAMLTTTAAAQKQQQRLGRGRRYDNDEENEDPTTTKGLSMALAAMTESMVATLQRLRDFPTTVRPFFFMSPSSSDDNGIIDDSSSTAAVAAFFDLLQDELERDPLRLPVHLHQLMMDRFQNSQSSSSWLILCSYFLVRLSRDLMIDDDDDDDDDDANDNVEKPKAMIIMNDEFLSSVLYYPEAAALVQVDDFLMHPMQATDEIMTTLSQHFAPPPSSPKYVLFVCLFVFFCFLGK
jgi:hypothetical protein